MNPLANKSLLSLSYKRGRVALYWILKALGVGKGDSVAIQAFTCMAVPEAVIATGASLRYIDIAEKTTNMCPTDLLRQIDDSVKAIVVQHTFGIPAEINKISEVAKSKGIPVIEDCCHQIASTLDGRLLGSFGIASFYSFEWGKPMVASIGGAATANDPSIYSKLLSSYSNIKTPQSNLFEVAQFLGFKLAYRPSFFWPLRALYRYLNQLGIGEGNFNEIHFNEPSIDFRLGMSKFAKRALIREIEKISQNIRHRKNIGDIYRDQINDGNGKTVCRRPENSETVYARYPLFFDDRPRAIKLAREKNVELADWYTSPVHPLEEINLSMVEYDTGSCPKAEQASRMIGSLPVGKAVSRSAAYKAASFIEKL